MGILKSFKKDLLQKELWPVKILMFLIYGGQAALYPYFTVHLKDLGVSIRQTSVIFAIQPIVALLVAPSIGMLADRIGNFKYIFSFFLVFSATTANLLLIVPPIELQNFQFNLSCDSSISGLNPPIISPSEPSIVDACSSSTNVALYGRFDQCSRHCIRTTDFSPLGMCVENGRNNTKIQFNRPFTVFVSVNDSCDPLSVLEVYYEGESYTNFYCNNTKQCNTTCTANSEAVDREDCSSQPFFGPTFYKYLSIRLVATLGIGLVNGLFDAASMAIVQELKADVGFQRFWATVGMCLFAPLSGHLVDTFGNFRPCFFMYGVMYVIAAATSLLLDLSMKLPSENSFANLAKLLTNAEVLLMLFHVAILGIYWGFLENFLFWFLESELSSSNLLLGLTVTVGSGTGLFMALVSTWCTRKLGYVNVMVLAFAAYTVRYIGYSYAEDAYVCLIYEMMENFTVTLLTVGVTLYCAELASMKMLTTMMTLWNGLHVISGRAFGSLIGGFLMHRIGARRTFRAFAVGSAFFGIFYFLVNVLWLKQWQKRKTKDIPDVVRDSSEISDVDSALNQAVMTLHCSQDSPSIIAYVPDTQTQNEPRRRALSHVVSPSDSFKNVTVPPRLTQSFRISRSNLTTIEETEDYEMRQVTIGEEDGSTSTRF